MLLFSMLCFTFVAKAKNEGDSIFNATQIHEIYMTFSKPNYWENITNFNFYPNPTSGFITINFEEKNKTNVIIIKNTLGELVYKNDSNNSTEFIDVSKLSSGLYFISINHSNTQKLQIVK